MPGPITARNYSEAAQLITRNQNAIFGVNSDGTIRTQNLKEKIGNLGLRLIGKFDSTKTEKDAKVATSTSEPVSKGRRPAKCYLYPSAESKLEAVF